MDLAWRRSFRCAVPVHRDVLQFHEVKVNKKIFVAEPSQRLRQTLCSF